jgi:release factor glutamine methyltransferase
MILKDLFKQGISNLTEYNIATPELDARILLQYVANISSEIIYLQQDLEISPNIKKNYLELLDRRINFEPVAKIIGSKSFWTSDFIVNTSVLDPRPDSEVIISSALELLPNKNDNYSFLDLGTGSGCLILSLLKEFSNATGTAIDISSEALKVSKQNAELLSLTDRITFLQQNWADGLTGKFDLIVSNPPYIPSKEITTLAPEVQIFDPMLALDGGDDGLNPYRYLAKQIAALLKPDAFAILEFGYGQANLVKEIFESHGYKFHRMLLDLANIERAIIVSAK